MNYGQLIAELEGYVKFLKTCHSPEDADDIKNTLEQVEELCNKARAAMEGWTR